MHSASDSWYVPLIDPRACDSLPLPPHAARTLVTPLRSHRGRRRDLTRALRRQPPRRLIGHFCVSDRTLRRFERTDPLGLRAAKAMGVDACVTMDVPWYGFMTAAQRERAQAQHAHRWWSSLERFARAGIDPILLVKGLRAEEWNPQLDLAAAHGLHDCAFYARELLLEQNHETLRRFVRDAIRRRLHPLLIGAFTPRALAWGPATLAGLHHYVLARRGRVLQPHGAQVRLDAPEYSPFLRRWIDPIDARALASHNLARAQQILTPSARLDAFPTGG